MQLHKALGVFERLFGETLWLHHQNVGDPGVDKGDDLHLVGDPEPRLRSPFGVDGAYGLSGCEGVAAQIAQRHSVSVEHHLKRLRVGVKPHVDGVLDLSLKILRDLEALF